LAVFGAPLESVAAQDFENPGTIFQIGLPPLRIDIITSIDGVEFDEAWQNRLETVLDGLAAMEVGREELLKNNKSTGSAVNDSILKAFMSMTVVADVHHIHGSELLDRACLLPPAAWP
jgi:hypothetical protein